MKYADYDRDTAKKALNEDGYVALREFIDHESVEEIKRNLDRYVKTIVPTLPREEVYYESPGKPDTLKQLQRLHQKDDFFRSIFIGSPLQEVAESLLDDGVSAQNLQYFDKPPAIGKATPPHQDGYYFMLDPCVAVTMWLALDVVDETNGCIRYVHASHLDPVRNHGRTDTLGFSQGVTDYGTPDDLVRERAFPAHPGDLLVHHAMTIHRADGNTTTDRHRRSLGFIYYGDRAKEDVVAKDLYQKRLNQALRKEGKV